MRASTTDSEITHIVEEPQLVVSTLEELEKESISDKYNTYPKPTHEYTTDGKDLKRHVDLKELFSNLEGPERTSDLSQKFYSKAKFMGVPPTGRAIRYKSSLVPRCGLSTTIPHAFWKS